MTKKLFAIQFGLARTRGWRFLLDSRQLRTPKTWRRLNRSCPAFYRRFFFARHAIRQVIWRSRPTFEGSAADQGLFGGNLCPFPAQRGHEPRAPKSQTTPKPPQL